MMRQGRIPHLIGLLFTLFLIITSTWNRYQGLMSGLEYSSVDYFKIIITKYSSPLEIVQNISYPENGLFLQNIFLLFPFKLLTVPFSLQFSYALSSFLVTVAASWLFYLILRKFLNKRLSLLLLWLLMFTQTSTSFLESINLHGKVFNRLGNLAILDFPNPSSVILSILIFYYFGVLKDAPPKSKIFLICLCLFLQVLVSPISSIICGTWAVAHYFMSVRSPRFHSTRKIRLTVFSLYWVLISSQVLILVRGRSANKESLIAGILKNQVFQFSWAYVVLYLVLPIAGIFLSRALMNVSWSEISHRFSFIIVLYFTSVLSMIYSFIVRDGALQAVLNASGITPLTNTLVYVPILCLLSEARFSHFLAVRNELFGKLTRILPFLLNATIVVLLCSVIVQTSWITISATHNRSQSNCPAFTDEDRIEIEQLVLNSTNLDLNGKKNLVLAYANHKMNPTDFTVFMQNPINSSNSDGLEEVSCVQKGLGYISLNGLNQSKISRIRATELVVIFTKNWAAK